jgi:hypothetical protein
MLRDRRGTLCGRLASMLEGQNSFKKMDLKHNKNWVKWLDILIIIFGKSQKYLNQQTFLTAQKSTNTRKQHKIHKFLESTKSLNHNIK